jgi:hypothetical protein
MSRMVPPARHQPACSRASARGRLRKRRQHDGLSSTAELALILRPGWSDARSASPWDLDEFREVIRGYSQ